MKSQITQYNVRWESQSRHAGDSMPCSGGDIGANVWVEDNQLFLYLARAGYRDENGALLKAGRLRITFSPDLFEGADFEQLLRLEDGSIRISSKNSDGIELRLKIWIEVNQPIVHIDVDCDKDIAVTAAYENWRFEDIELPNDANKMERRSMCMLNYDSYEGDVFLYKDIIRADDDRVCFHHQIDNRKDIFNFQIPQQHLDAVRGDMVNPLADLIWGSCLAADNFSLQEECSGSYAACPCKGWVYKSNSASKTHRLRVCMHLDHCKDLESWDAGLQKLVDLDPSYDKQAWEENCSWWQAFWERSYLIINSNRGESDIGWRIGRNYQLFRYMLASNVHGVEASLFNGGLFTFDPLFINGKKEKGYTPDHRQWGSGLTAQNQRLLLWPLLKSGDFDMLQPGFSLYLNCLPNAKARVRHYWGHDGCCFTEQTAITGLPGAAVYGFEQQSGRKRKSDLDRATQVAGAIRYLFDSQLEYAWMMLRYCQFAGQDLEPYLEFIEQSVIFYDAHYRYRHKEATGDELDADGKLVIYPSNALEGHVDARNPSSVIAGLTRLVNELLRLPDKVVPADKKEYYSSLLNRLPLMPLGEKADIPGPYLKPSENYEHSSSHCPEMYALYPYELYGQGLPDLNLMENTFLALGEDRYISICWIQSNIHAARLGDTALAKQLNAEKMDDGPWRFPAFWPHDIDWAPDHNWGGTGMIGMQEMLLQTHALPGEQEKLRVLPAWPEEWDVDFKLHAPGQTIISAVYQDAELKKLDVEPPERQADIIVGDCE